MVLLIVNCVFFNDKCLLMFNQCLYIDIFLRKKTPVSRDGQFSQWQYSQCQKYVECGSQMTIP